MKELNLPWRVWDAGVVLDSKDNVVLFSDFPEEIVAAVNQPTALFIDSMTAQSYSRRLALHEVSLKLHKAGVLPSRVINMEISEELDVACVTVFFWSDKESRG